MGDRDKEFAGARLKGTNVALEGGTSRKMIDLRKAKLVR